MYGDYLFNAQGEDVVAGIRNTQPIAQLKDDMPEVYEEFIEICDKLENYYHDMQDVEFTIEQRKLWMLQTRDGKRTARAAIKIAVDMANEGMITKEQAVMRVTPEQVDMLLHPQFGGETKRAGCRRRHAVWSRRPSMPAPAQPLVLQPLTPTPPRSGAKRARPSSWFAPRPDPTTSTA